MVTFGKTPHEVLTLTTTPPTPVSCSFVVPQTKGTAPESTCVPSTSNLHFCDKKLVTTSTGNHGPLWSWRAGRRSRRTPSYLTKIKGLWCWDSYSIPVEFTSPTATTSLIGEYGPQRLNAISAPTTFLDLVRGTDDLSFHLVLDLFAAETHQRADLQAALAQRS